MATMDIIKLHGGEPANFLDVGGGATVEQVRPPLGSRIWRLDISLKSTRKTFFVIPRFRKA